MSDIILNILSAVIGGLFLILAYWLVTGQPDGLTAATVHALLNGLYK